MEIGKTAAISAQELAKLYGQRTEAESAQAAEGMAEMGTGRSAAAATAPAMVEISDEARSRAERLESLQLARELYDRLPAVRSEVVASVRERLAAGHYDSQAVKDALADRLMNLARRLDLASR